MPIRILHVLGSLTRGGAQAMIMNLYRNIDRSKVQFDFIVHTNQKYEYDEEVMALGGNIFHFPVYKGRNHFKYCREWSNFFKEHPEYKIIHGHVRSTAAIYLKIAKRNGLETIAHSHNTSSGKGFSALVKNILQFPIRYTSNHFFACSQYAGEWLFGKQVPKKNNFYIINNAIESKKYIFNKKIRSVKRQELNIEGKFVLGHIGRFHPQKNHEFLIKIFEDVIKVNSNTILLLVGGGDLEIKIREMVKNRSLEDKVIFLGIRDDIPELMMAMDLLVFPSLFEGLGMVVIEAQAAGLKCLVSNSIPKEAFLTDLVKALPLSIPKKEWVIEISNCSNYYRDDTSNTISNKGYDIEQNAKWLENFYIKRYKIIKNKREI